MTQTNAPSMCFVCFEVAFTSLNNRILTSKVCGHKVCNSCLQSRGHPAPFANESARRSHDAKPPEKIYICPLCDKDVPSSDWVERESDETFFEREALISQRVCSVYNLTRNHFETTPKYNDYLEMREGIIYDLVYNPNEKERKRIQEELEVYEAEHQKQIVECQQLAKKMEREWIRDIVKKEGTFYERVQHNTFLGSNTTKLIHPLRRRYTDLFVEDESKLNNSTKDSRSNSQDQTLIGVVLGTSGVPKLLDPSLNYAKLTKKPCTDKQGFLRACGMSKNTVRHRVLQEVWQGLAFR